MRRPEGQIQRLSEVVADCTAAFDPVDGFTNEISDVLRWVAHLETGHREADDAFGLAINERNEASRERDRAIRALARCRGELEACRQVIQDVLDDDLREPAPWFFEATNEVLADLVTTMRETSAEALKLDHLTLPLLSDAPEAT